MFHPLIVSLCFSIMYILFHSIPSSSSLSVLHYHIEASCYVWSSPHCFIWVQFFQNHTTLILSHISTFHVSYLQHFHRFFFSLILDRFLVSLPSICILSTSGLSLILSTIPLLLTSWYSKHWCLCSFWKLDLSEHYLCSTIWCYSSWIPLH